MSDSTANAPAPGPAAPESPEPELASKVEASLGGADGPADDPAVAKRALGEIATFWRSELTTLRQQWKVAVALGDEEIKQTIRRGAARALTAIEAAEAELRKFAS